MSPFNDSPLNAFPRFVLSARRTGCSLEPAADGVPTYVGEERFDIFRPVGGCVILDPGVLPHVHYQYRLIAGDVAGFVEIDPVIRDGAVRRVLICRGPADAPHFAGRDKIGLPNVIAAKTFLSGLEKRRIFARV